MSMRAHRCKQWHGALHRDTRPVSRAVDASTVCVGLGSTFHSSGVLKTARRWEALEAAFAEIVETGGDMAQYKQRWRQGHWWWLTTASDVVYAGPNVGMNCKKARLQGMIS